jgi:hypothetical protein
VFLHAASGSPRRKDDSIMIGTDALNAYQQRFLASHCWPTGPSPTMCEGDMYIAIAHDARGLFVSAQLVGADLAEALEEAVRADFAAFRTREEITLEFGRQRADAQRGPRSE